MFHNLIRSIFIFLIFTTPTLASDFKVLNISGVIHEGSPAIAVVFSEPLNKSRNYDIFFKIFTDTSVSNTRGVFNNDGRILYFTGLQPDTHYVIQIGENIKSYNGLTLKPYKSVYEITTPVMKPSVNFISKGVNIVSSTEPPVRLPVNAINVDNVLVSFYLEELELDSNADIYLSLENIRKNSSYQDLRAGSAKTSYWFTPNGVFMGSKAYNLNAIGKQITTNIDIPDELLAYKGLYHVVLKYGGGKNSSYFEIAHFVVSDIGLHAVKAINSNSVDIWARSHFTGKPLQGINITSMGVNNTDWISCTTGQDGRCQLENADSFIFATDGNEFSLLPLNSQLDVSNFNLSGQNLQSSKIFVYGPRDLYRGCETARWNILIRDSDGKAVYLPPVDIKLINPKGDLVSRHSVSFDSSLANYDYSYDIPHDAPVGSWKLVIESRKNVVEHVFSVEDFMPETMKLTLGKPGEEVLTTYNNASKLYIHGEYYHGAPAAKNRYNVDYRVGYASKIQGSWSSYFFHNPETVYSTVKSKSIEDRTLDEEGKAVVGIDTNILKDFGDKSPIKILYMTTLFEDGGKGMTRSKEYIYFPTKSAIGIKQINNSESDSNSAEFDIVNLSSSGILEPAKVKITLKKINRNYQWKYIEYKGWGYEYIDIVYPVSDTLVELGKTPYRHVMQGLENGLYQIEVVNLNTNQFVNYNFSLGYYWSEYDDISDSDFYKPEELTLVPDKPYYKAGEKVVINVKSPYDGKGMFTLESSDGIIFHDNIEVVNKTGQISFFLPENISRHDIYATAYIIRPEKEMEKNQKSYIMGFQYIKLDRTNKKIELDLIHPERFISGQDFKVSVKMKDKKFHNQKVMVTLSAVDEGVLSIKSNENKNPWDFFYGKIRYSNVIWDSFWQIIHKFSDRFAIRYGGDIQLIARSRQLARADVKIMSLFKGPVYFNEVGEAEFKLNIEDFNGEIHLTAVAYSKDSYGMQESSMIITEQIASELSRPRFLGSGDKASLFLTLQNTTDQPLEPNVTVDASGAAQLVSKAFKESIHLEPHKKKIFEIPIRANKTFGEGNLFLDIAGIEHLINKKWRLDIRPAYPVYSKNTILNLTEDETATFEIEDSSKYYDGSLYYTLVIDPGSGLNYKGYLKSLTEYPYECLEQLTSISFSLLNTNDKYLPNNYEIFTEIKSRIKKLWSKQLPSGGFGYWDSRSSESLWGTVFAADFLNEAFRKGYDVDKKKLDNLNKRVIEYARSGLNHSNTFSFYDRKSYINSTRAYAFYVLSKNGIPLLSDVKSYYEATYKTFDDPIWLLQLAIALRNSGDSKVAAEAYKKAIKNFDTNIYTYYSGDYGSRIRNYALGIYLIDEYNKGSDRNSLKPYIKTLVDIIGKSFWTSTQEKFQIIRLASTIERDDEVTAVINTGVRKETVTSKGPLTMNIDSTDITAPLEVTLKSAQPVYVSFESSGYTKKIQEPYSLNSSIKRFYYDIQGNPLNIDRVNSGDIVLVKLVFDSKFNTSEGLIVDLLPAGFELENQNLDNSIKVDKNIDILKECLQADSIYSEYRDDRYVNAVRLYQDYEYCDYYIMRAVTIGEFQNPQPYFEDMYRGDIRALGHAEPEIIRITGDNKKVENKEMSDIQILSIDYEGNSGEHAGADLLNNIFQEKKTYTSDAALSKNETGIMSVANNYIR